MGLISSGLQALNSTIADQWKEYFYCEAMENGVLVERGHKRVSGLFAGNRGNDNIITTGSGIAVADGQCMIIVEDGKIVEVCAEPGLYTFDSSSEPSIFVGGLGEGLKKSFETFKKRFTYGGEPGKDQRVYYFNTKEILDNKFGTNTPVPFRVVDSRINLDVDIQIRCAGTYSFRITDPILFYANVCGNVAEAYYVDQLKDTLRIEFVSALQPALAKLSTLELRPSEIIAHNTELENALNDALDAKWNELRGIQVVNVALATVSLTEEDQKLITDAQKAAMYTNPFIKDAGLTDATITAMKDAAKNPNGPAMAYYGVNMAQNAGMAAGIAPTQTQQYAWYCPNCGTGCNGNFCSVCGTKKPE